MADIVEVYDPGGFFSAGFLSQRPLSRRCHDHIKVWLVQSQDLDVRLILQIDIVIVSFLIHRQCHTDIEGDVTAISLQYQNVHWASSRTWLHRGIFPSFPRPRAQGKSQLKVKVRIIKSWNYPNIHWIPHFSLKLQNDNERTFNLRWPNKKINV